MIALIRSPGDVNPTEYGPKGWNLTKLAAAGEPVPEGFLIPTSESLKFANEAGLSEIIDKKIDINKLYDEILNRYKKTLIKNESIEKLIDEGFKLCPKLEGVPLAIRSSAAFEDSKNASCAGQHDSIIGVVDKNLMKAAIVKCWASQWNKWAIYYRQARGLKGEKPNMGLIVQELVMAEKSGVMFTKDPSFGEQYLIIEASKGLGEKLVSGQIVPNRYRVHRQFFTIVEKRITNNELSGLLSDVEIDALSQAAERIENLFGIPQDIEWAFLKSKLFILQARPITG